MMKKQGKYPTAKEKHDDAVMAYVASRIFEDPKDSDAAIHGMSDETGKLTSTPKEEEYWKLTDLDRFIKHLKAVVGTKRLREFCEPYAHVKDVDPMRFISGKTDGKTTEAMKKIVSAVEDRSFLPPNAFRANEIFSWTEDGFRGRTAFALTALCWLVHALRSGHAPTSIDFEKDIVPSVEHTFSVRGTGDFKKMQDFLRECGLADLSGIKDAGVRLAVGCAKVAAESGLLAGDGDALDMTRSFERLAST